MRASSPSSRSIRCSRLRRTDQDPSAVATITASTAAASAVKKILARKVTGLRSVNGKCQMTNGKWQMTDGQCRSSPILSFGIRHSTLSRVLQPVAELLDGHDRVAQEWQLLAEAPDVHVDGARAAGVLVTPHVGQQEVAGEHAAAVLDQVLEQQEFLGREPDVAAIHRDGVAIDIDDERP